MISEAQLMALSKHLAELEAELEAVTPLFECCKDKAEAVNDLFKVIQADS